MSAKQITPSASVAALVYYAHDTPSKRSMLSDALHDRTVVRLVLCKDGGVLECEMDKNIPLNVESLYHDNSHVSQLLEQAVLGDAFACHALTNDYVCIATDNKSNTIEQALSLPGRKFWK